MKEFNDYTYADINESDNKKIKDLEQELKKETGDDVVLIAYKEK